MSEHQINGKTYVTLQEMSIRSGYSVEHLRKLANKHQIDAIQIARDWLVNPESLQDYQAKWPNRKPHKS